MYTCSNTIKNQLTDSSFYENSKRIDTNDFIDFYNDVSTLLKRMNKRDKEKFPEISYTNIFRIYLYTLHFEYTEKMISPLAHEWENQYGIYHSKADSLMTYWRQEKEKSNLSKYLKIDITDIQKFTKRGVNEDEDYADSVEVAFKLTPLHKNIKNVKFCFTYTKKDNPNYSPENHFSFDKKLPDSLIEYQPLDFIDYAWIMKSETIAEFLKDYEYKIVITDLTVEGNEYHLYDPVMPQSVKEVLELETKEIYWYESRQNTIIKETLCSDYIPKNRFIEEKLLNELLRRYPAECNFLKWMISQRNYDWE